VTDGINDSAGIANDVDRGRFGHRGGPVFLNIREVILAVVYGIWLQWTGVKPSRIYGVKDLNGVINMRVLRPSRKKPQRGDVFVLQLPDNDYLFGRVISTTASIGPMKNVILIYIFRTHSKKPELPNREVLSPNNLLLSPIMTNLLPWSKGYFMTVDHLVFMKGETLARHCFLWEWKDKTHFKRYFDESNNELPGPTGPVGIHGLHSYRTIDDEISKSLDLPLAQDGFASPAINRERNDSTPRRIRIIPSGDNELKRLLRLEDELMDAGVVWDAGYSTEESGRIWQVNTGKGMSWEDLLRKLEKEGLRTETD
jgi:hypothetical protein